MGGPIVMGGTNCYGTPRKGPEYLYRLFNLLSKQTTCEMKTLRIQVYIQQWFQDEQGAEFM